MSKKRFLTGLAIGAGLGVLFAPKSGAQTRRELKEKLDYLLEKIKEEYEDLDDFGYFLEDKIIDIKNELRSLDKTKVKRIAKEQAKKIKAKSEELYKAAVEKGTPVMQKAAGDVREKSAELLHKMADKLEQ